MARKKADRKKKMVGTMIYEDLIERIKERAQNKGLTISAYISEIVEKELLQNTSIENMININENTIVPIVEKEHMINVNEIESRPKILKTNNPHIYDCEKGKGNAELIARKLGITVQQVKEWAE